MFIILIVSAWAKSRILFNNLRQCYQIPLIASVMKQGPVYHHYSAILLAPLLWSLTTLSNSGNNYANEWLMRLNRISIIIIGLIPSRHFLFRLSYPLSCARDTIMQTPVNIITLVYLRKLHNTQTAGYQLSLTPSSWSRDWVTLSLILKQNPGFSSCCNHNYKRSVRKPHGFYKPIPCLSRYFMIGNRNQILRFPNGFHYTTVYWGKWVR